MNLKSFIIACASALVAGILLFLYMHEIIIIRTPSTYSLPVSSHALKKTVPISFWKHEKWNRETRELVWAPQMETQITQLLNSFFELVHEEHIVHKKVTVQATLIPSKSRTAYISFDRLPFNKEDLTYNKWMLIESLLKTIRDNISNIDSIQLLVSHTIIHDQHLDFSKPWPVTGFLKHCNNSATR